MLKRFVLHFFACYRLWRNSGILSWWSIKVYSFYNTVWTFKWEPSCTYLTINEWWIFSEICGWTLRSVVRLCTYCTSGNKFSISRNTSECKGECLFIGSHFKSAWYIAKSCSTDWDMTWLRIVCVLKWMRMLSWPSLSLQVFIFTIFAWKCVFIMTTRLCTGQPENWGLFLGGAQIFLSPVIGITVNADIFSSEWYGKLC